MKAAICYEFGQALVLEDVTLDPPQQGEVHVRIAATGICHSDLHAISGEWGGADTLPFVVGHESSGTVVDVGSGVTRFKPGDRVVVTLIRSCGHCFYCRAGFPTRCETQFALHSENRIHNSRGEPINVRLYTGSFAEEVVVHESQIVKMPDAVGFEVAALMACGVITGAGAVFNTTPIRAGSSVVVIGTGGVGLNAVQAARIAGAYPIIAVDTLDNKLEIAHQFGATHSANPSTEDAIAIVKQLTAGRGADYVFVTVGSTRASEQGFEMLRPRGILTVVGIPEAGAKAAFPVMGFVQERMVTGSFMGSTRIETDIPRLFSLYLNGQLMLDQLVSKRWPLAMINEAIADSANGNAIRNVIVF